MKTVEARAILEAAKKQAESMGKAVTICVLDAAGLMMAFERVGEPGAFTSAMAEGKAVGAAFAGRNSADLEAMLERVPGAVHAMIARHNGRLIPRQGAVVLLRNGDVMGAVGTSGATSEEDEQISNAGAAVFR